MLRPSRRWLGKECGEMFRELLTEWKALHHNKKYCLLLILTAVLSYGYLITHHTVGIDDTPYLYYFEEGLAAIVGRWVLFVLNKLVAIAEFAPFVTDLAGVLILMAAVGVWCVLWKKIFGDRIPEWGYWLFSSLFLSNPLLSEVFTYYLHNGVALGYLCSGISLWCFWYAVGKQQGGLIKLGQALGLSALFLTIAIGCYESFMIVYIVGVCLMLCSVRMQITERRIPVFANLGKGAAVTVAAIVCRGLTVKAVTVCFGLQYLQDEAVHRSITEMVGWILEPEALAELGMILKRVYVMYGVFGLAYYPIAIYVLALVLTLIITIRRGIGKKDSWIPLLAVAAMAASYLLVLIEGKATLYRAAQFLPVFSAWGLLLAASECRSLSEWLVGIVDGKVSGQRSLGLRFIQKISAVPLSIGAFCLCVILWNQCTDMNRWFYVDSLKYEDAKNTMNQIAYELEKSYDISKPVIFTGTYHMPQSIIQDAYVPYGSTVYYRMHRLTDFLDEHLLEKFYREYGVWVAQTPSLSVLDWGRYAFDTDEELVRFFAMHGHEIQPLLDTSLYAPAEEYSLKLPSFPQQGSIVDMGNYIIVHF